MGKKEKKRFFLNHKKSSALFVSVIVHVVFLLIAATFVAVSVIVKNEVDFEAKPVKRPKIELRKLQVPVDAKKNRQPPKLRKTIVINTPKPTVDIQMPEIVGVKGGLGAAGGGGFSLGFDFDMDLFGGNSRAGNDFIGTFYDLKQDKKGNPTELGKLLETNRGAAEVMCHEIVNRFLSSGWKESRLEDYFAAPKQKFARFFNIPPMPADNAPSAFQVGDLVKPGYWLCVYRGQIVAPETGKYRFWGLGDDLLVVRVNGKLVLDASWVETYGTLDRWRSSDGDSMRYPINQKSAGPFKGGNFMDYYEDIKKGIENGGGGSRTLDSIKIDDKSLTQLGNYFSVFNRLTIGDWFDLKAGQTVDMEVLIGEIPGSKFSCRLLVQQKGRQYRMVESDAGARPVLPMFKTAPVPDQLMNQMEADPNEMTLQGPSFGVDKTN